VRSEPTQFAVALADQTKYRYSLTGRSHGKLGRFTSHSLPVSSDDVRSDEMNQRGQSGRDCDWRACVKVVRHCGVSCDPDSRDELGNDQRAIEAAGDVVRSHLPGVEATPSIVETCLYTVGQCASVISLAEAVVFVVFNAFMSIKSVSVCLPVSVMVTAV